MSKLTDVEAALKWADYYIEKDWDLEDWEKPFEFHSRGCTCCEQEYELSNKDALPVLRAMAERARKEAEAHDKRADDLEAYLKGDTDDSDA
jgi:hypothetical protein